MSIDSKAKIDAMEGRLGFGVIVCPQRAVDQSIGCGLTVDTLVFASVVMFAFVVLSEYVIRVEPKPNY